MQRDGLRKLLIAMLCMPALSLAATLNGRVVLAGTAPAAKKIDVTIDQYLCGNQKEAQDLILSARNEVAKAWVAEAALQHARGDEAAVRELLERALGRFEELGTLDESLGFRLRRRTLHPHKIDAYGKDESSVAGDRRILPS